MSHEMMNSRERRLFSWSNATCAMPSCEALSSRRGLGPHHAHKDRVGTWNISRLAVSCLRRRSASGRRGAIADDVRAREVGLRHSSCEAGEQSGAIRCGASGAKGGDQGECGSAKHAPDSEPGKRVTRAGAHTASVTKNALPSHTQGGSRVREFCTHGSARGAVSNDRPYRTSYRVLLTLCRVSDAG